MFSFLFFGIFKLSPWYQRLLCSFWKVAVNLGQRKHKIRRGSGCKTQSERGSGTRYTPIIIEPHVDVFAHQVKIEPTRDKELDLRFVKENVLHGQ